MAHGRRMLLLSSDDRMQPCKAIEAYLPGSTQADERAARGLGQGDLGDRCRWRAPPGGSIPIPLCAVRSTNHSSSSRAVGLPVWSMAALEMLASPWTLLRTPLPFATTCYPRALHDRRRRL